MEIYSLLALSWRNLWRHRRRTLISVLSIAIGLTLVVFAKCLNEGAYDQMVGDAVRMQAGHITLEHRDYREAPAVDLAITVDDELRRRVESLPGVAAGKLIVNGQGVARSGAGAIGVGIMGVEPAVEARTSPFARKLVAGEYLRPGDGAKVVIGAGLADRLDLKVGRKLVLASNDIEGDLVEQLFRVQGVFSTGAEEIDGYFIQAPISAIRDLYGLAPDQTTQLGVVLESADELGRMVRKVRAIAATGDRVVLPWQRVLPELAGMIRVDRVSDSVMFWLLLSLTLFTIFNTMLMSVLEREREFAVLLALGTPPGQLRVQVLIETALIAVLGCGLGLLVGGVWAYRVQLYGWDISALLSEGTSMSGFAMEPVLYAKVTSGILARLGGTLFGVIMLLSLIPMRRAAAVRIADTLR